LQADYVTVIDRPIFSAEYRLPLLATTDPPCSAVSLRLLSYSSSDNIPAAEEHPELSNLRDSDQVS